MWESPGRILKNDQLTQTSCYASVSSSKNYMCSPDAAAFGAVEHSDIQTGSPSFLLCLVISRMSSPVKTHITANSFEPRFTGTPLRSVCSNDGKHLLVRTLCINVPHSKDAGIRGNWLESIEDSGASSKDPTETHPKM